MFAESAFGVEAYRYLVSSQGFGNVTVHAMKFVEILGFG